MSLSVVGVLSRREVGGESSSVIAIGLDAGLAAPSQEGLRVYDDLFEAMSRALEAGDRALDFVEPLGVRRLECRVNLSPPAPVLFPEPGNSDDSQLGHSKLSGVAR
jgi:hypothetical protein